MVVNKIGDRGVGLLALGVRKNKSITELGLASECYTYICIIHIHRHMAVLYVLGM
jgi:hypothetical protein